ncbi:methylated-DNA--[protein]-cysteine S-methyltransferase [Pseudohoeflea coraliihabitans]|uniref:Bifunctional helix-turn-helix domain-containing protein/methylated-DNA--[protein]-cysteine S-methyltransferase n=1 Tax=Pseudohoeflea coraliihabitans TaxID=2860393 RepID=A0ABS6WNY5_9HYPH|nr:bifunctional helix-turn-helix domain-containing protein/methylated-DNA--[protein]-cysteine S-methyltransferase [Pseudohoeflea sp. DP4N28-3]MBW3097671.1 bifunctional helix-turn-helix domain-containing protein/methylated-DNA--[protein]-cysteine S-methyltransferase [Pseudohoeflea sp. DP4N28-3]
MTIPLRLDQEITPEGNDYALISHVIERISLDYRSQPTLEELAADLQIAPAQLQRTFSRWAGLSPKAFLQAVTLDHARRLIGEERLPLLEASHELGLSGPGRLHDLFVTHEAMSPGDFKSGGAQLQIQYGFHPSPFGTALVMATERGLCGVGFADPDGEDAALDDMARRWPAARLVHDHAATAGYVARIFAPENWRADQPLRIVLIGTDFQVRVWQALLQIPLGQAQSYADVARSIGQPKAARAVGAAIGRNPISFVVPCHRALGKSGALTGYHWGLTRKRAMLGWETGRVAAASQQAC